MGAARDEARSWLVLFSQSIFFLGILFFESQRVPVLAIYTIAVITVKTAVFAGVYDHD